VYRTVIQDTLFAVSPLHYSTVSFLVTVIVAMVVSFVTGKYNFVIAEFRGIWRRMTQRQEEVI